MEFQHKMVEKVCQDCGKPFIGDPRKLYCFDCIHKRDVERRKANKQKREHRRISKECESEQKPKGLTLSDVAKLANAAGMSYGQYVARKA